MGWNSNVSEGSVSSMNQIPTNWKAESFKVIGLVVFH